MEMVPVYVSAIARLAERIIQNSNRTNFIFLWELNVGALLVWELDDGNKATLHVSGKTVCENTEMITISTSVQESKL